MLLLSETTLANRVSRGDLDIELLVCIPSLGVRGWEHVAEHNVHTG